MRGQCRHYAERRPSSRPLFAPASWNSPEFKDRSKDYKHIILILSTAALPAEKERAACEARGPFCQIRRRRLLDLRRATDRGLCGRRNHFRLLAGAIEPVG